MARVKEDIAAISRALIDDARNGVFKPVYILMGDEPYYPDLVCQAIIDNCVDEFGKDFNETICYGADVTAEQVVTAARRFPMMADRQLVVVKEAQMMKTLEDIAVYCNEPLDSTVLVLLLHKATVDKRKALYKSVQKIGVVLDSPALRDYEVPAWISSYYRERGLQIDPEAASLLAESVGTDLSTIALETDKLLKNLPEGSKSVSVADIEKNVGISRQFSIFELTKELSYKHASKALTIAAHLGNAARFAMPQAVSALYMHFYRILKYGALLARGGAPTPDEKASALAGVNPYFYKEYDTAVRNYPLPKAMAVISLLCEYDYLGKGGDGGAATPGELMVELTAKILNC
jgi:DNA polymerase-3 subunit delta